VVCPPGIGMGLHANFIRGSDEFIAKYAMEARELMHLDAYARELGFAGYRQAKRGVRDNSMHPVCHGLREVAERRLTTGVGLRLFDVSVELFAGKRLATAAHGTYPQVVTADAARLADAAYPTPNRCLCNFPVVCVKCKPRPGSSVLVVDVYALKGDEVEAYLREHQVSLLSLQWVHPSDQVGYLGGSEMYCTRLTDTVYGYAVPAGASDVPLAASTIAAYAHTLTACVDGYLAAAPYSMLSDEYVHARWLETFGAGVNITDVYELTDPLFPDRAVYTLVRIEPVAHICVAPAMSAIDREALKVAAYTPEQQRGTLLRTLVNAELVTLENAHEVVEGLVRDLATRARVARSRHTPLDSVSVAMSAKLQKDASLTSRLPLLTYAWLRFVSLPLRLRLMACLVLFVVSNVLLCVNWTSTLAPALSAATVAAWRWPGGFALLGLFIVLAFACARIVTI